MICATPLPGFWFFDRLHLHLNTFPQIVGRIHHDFCSFRQPVEHFQLRAEIAPHMNRVPVNMIVLRSYSLSEKISHNMVSLLSTKHLKLPTPASLCEVACLLSDPAHLHDAEIVALAD